MRANDRRVMREHVPLEVEEVIDQADGPHTYLSAKFPLLDSARQALRGVRDRDGHHGAQARRGDAARVRAALPPDRRHGARRIRRDGRHGADHGLEPAGRGDVRLDRAARRSVATSPRRSSRARYRGDAQPRRWSGSYRAARERCWAGASSSRPCTATGTSSPWSSRSARCGWAARTPSTPSCTTSPSESRPRRRCAGSPTSSSPRTTRSSRPGPAGR